MSGHLFDIGFGFQVFINEGEVNQIRDWVSEYDSTETGGDLFGLWIDKQTAVVQFVLGPGKECRRTSTSFFQDVDYLKNAGSYLTKAHGLCNIGQWHSHHRIRLFEPSAGDNKTVWNNMPGLGLDKYIVFIANITDKVEVNCFLYQMKNDRAHPVKGKFHYLEGKSPLRLNENVLQNIHKGAEKRLNQIANYDKESCYYIVDERTRENESRNYTGNDVHSGAIVTLVNDEKNENIFTPHRMFGKTALKGWSSNSVVPVQNASGPISRPESYIQPFAKSPCYSEENSLKRQKETGELVKVETSDIPIYSAQAFGTVKNYECPGINSSVKVRDNFDNLKHNRNDVHNAHALPSQQNSICGWANTSSTKRSETREKYQSDTDQIINDASNRTASSVESNYELSRTNTTEKLEKQPVNLSKADRIFNETECYKLEVVGTPEPIGHDVAICNTSITQTVVATPAQQRNVGQINHGHPEATLKRQQRETPQVVYEGGHQTNKKQDDRTITQQPKRGSWYDNLKNKPELMDVDQTTNIKQCDPNDVCQQSRPVTPSGTMLQNTSEIATKDANHSDEDISMLCGLFSKLSLCSSSK